jgi:peptide/nickel transport system ATP-binding protein
MTALLEVSDLVCRYPGRRRGLFRRGAPIHAVTGISLRVAQGEVLAIVGESGCGKTTLARAILGLLRPASGSVRLDGRPLGAMSRAELARQVLPVFQDPYSSLNPSKSVASIVALPLRLNRIPAAERRRRVGAMLARVGLSERHLERRPHQLSGGQRQRVAIARALIMEPKLVVCDEPTSALDVSVQAQILNLLMQLRRDLGLSYVLISHNLAVVERLADRVAIMYFGRIVESGPAAEVFANPRHPYTRMLTAAVLSPDPEMPLPAAGLGGEVPNPTAPPSGCAFHPRCPNVMPRCREQAPVLRKVGSIEVACHLFEG